MSATKPSAGGDAQREILGVEQLLAFERKGHIKVEACVAKDETEKLFAAVFAEYMRRRKEVCVIKH